MYFIKRIEAKLKGFSHTTHYENLNDIVYIQCGRHDIKIHSNESKNVITETTNTNSTTLNDFVLVTINKSTSQKKLHILLKFIKAILLIFDVSPIDVKSNVRIDFKNVENTLPFGSAELRNETLTKWRTILNLTNNF